MSWVKYDLKRKDDLLNHEQTHFDLSEIYARKVRKEFSELLDPCGKSDDELNIIVNLFLEKFQEEERKYDKETEHGLNEELQYEWDQKVYADLEGLKQFRFNKYVFVT